MKKSLLIIAVVLILDQVSKFYIKTHFYLREYVDVLPWFKIVFEENPGMAYGFHFGGSLGKLVLSIVRIVLIFGIGLWLFRHLRSNKPNLYLYIPISLVFAGALGNLIDSTLYGVVFDKGKTFDPILQEWVGYSGLAQANFKGYAGPLYGAVVDMLHFPLYDDVLPNWIPIKGGEHFTFFQPVFNIADAAISIGVFLMLIFYKKTLS